MLLESHENVNTMKYAGHTAIHSGPCTTNSGPVIRLQWKHVVHIREKTILAKRQHLHQNCNEKKMADNNNFSGRYFYISQCFHVYLYLFFNVIHLLTNKSKYKYTCGFYFVKSEHNSQPGLFSAKTSV